MTKAKPKAKAAPKKPTGRPSGYNPRYARIAFRMCLIGATDEHIAKAFDVSIRQFYEWKKTYPALLQALKEAREEADNRVVESLYKRACGYTHKAVKIFMHEGKPVYAPYTEHYPPDTGAAAFWLKNRQREHWKDRRDVETTAVEPPGTAKRREDLIAILMTMLDAKARAVLAPAMKTLNLAPDGQAAAPAKDDPSRPLATIRSPK